MVEDSAKQALAGNEQEIERLSRFGVEAKLTESGPVVVYKADGEVAAWIV
jgi:hypothetical protein